MYLSFAAATLASAFVVLMTSQQSFALPQSIRHEARSLRYTGQNVDRSVDVFSSSVSNAATAKEKGILTPAVSSWVFLGASVQEPSMQYVPQPVISQPKIPAELFSTGIVNNSLSESHVMYQGSGSLKVNASNENALESLTRRPSMSRDGGRGGYLNGQRIFTFCDTASYGFAADSFDSVWTGFVSNSIAVDKGYQAAQGKAVVLEDPIGEWANSEGTMRGWIPLTDTEQAFNDKMINQSQRYAIWPSSSLIPLNQHTALLYAPIVYVNGQSEQHEYTTAGTTLLSITVPGKGGPIAERVVPLLFSYNELAWGTLAGLRSFGPNGVDGGLIYVAANNQQGLFLGRTNASTATEKSSYEYWHAGGKWSSCMPSSSDNQDLFVKGSFSSADIFYSPLHATFLMIYQDGYADNKFYWQYLKSDKAIYPQPATTDGSDFVENITKYPWSEPQILLNLPRPGNGEYSYAGGVHKGYFEGDDITNGGKKMLLSWTSPTGQDAGSVTTGFSLMTAEIGWE